MCESEIVIGELIYRNIDEVCRYHNMCDSLEEIFDDIYIEDIQSIKNIDEGVKDYIKSQCKNNNFNFKQILNKIKDNDYCIEDTIDKEIEYKEYLLEQLSKEITVFGKLHTFESACKEYDKDYFQIKERLEKGWSPEEAFTIDKQSKINSIIFHLEGNIYTMPNACEKYKIPRYIINKRLNVGWSNEEAFEIVPKEFPKISNDCTTYYRPLKDIKKSWTKYGYKKYYDELLRLTHLQQEIVHRIDNDTLYMCKFGFNTSPGQYFYRGYGCREFEGENGLYNRYFFGCKCCVNYILASRFKELIGHSEIKRIHIDVCNHTYIYVHKY